MSAWGTDLPFAPVPLWVLELPLSDRAVRLYALLAGLRDYSTDQASFGRKLLAKKLRCSDDSLDRAKAELEKHGAISVERGVTSAGSIARNVYTVHRIPPGNRTAAVSGESAPERVADTRTPAVTNEKNPLNEKKLLTYTQIADAWLGHAGLISHRESYFASHDVRYRIDQAVKRYGLDDVIAAIASYATVLASPKHFFDYSWTLGDFLKRGLDRFVPEAKPEETFRGPGSRVTSDSSGHNGGNESTYTKA